MADKINNNDVVVRALLARFKHNGFENKFNVMTELVAEGKNLGVIEMMMQGMFSRRELEAVRRAIDGGRIETLLNEKAIV